MTSSEGRAPGRPPRRWGLRNWRVRSRLIALIAVPTVVAVALGALGLSGSLAGAAAYQRVGALAGIAGALTGTVGDLQAEQAQSAAYVGAGRPADRARAVTDAQRRTDAGTARLRERAAVVGDAYPASTRDRLRRVLYRLDTLPALRSAVTTGRFPAGVTVDRYDTVVADLIVLDDGIAQEGTDPELSTSVQALGALSRARAALGTQRALLEAALLAGRFEPGGADTFVRAIAAQDAALEQFRTTASVTRRYDDVVTGPDVDQTSAIRDGITAGRPPAGGAAAAGAWDAAASGTLGKVATVESGLVTAVADRAEQLRSDAQRQALVVGILALLVVLVVLLATTAVARSLVRPLRALRDGALSVAERTLPETVARLGREDPDAVDVRVQPVAVYTTDEIGEVARSFDAVHSEAVRAAVAEARRRAQAGALFVTLSRRTQSLVDRQIELIDDLEQGEQDADRLDSLFRLDHLATRMRRNGENLLVLGGQEPVRRWNRALPLLDVLRAALSEVEQYPRIDLDEVPGVTVAEGAVSDVVHLLAELLDNATAFSSRATRVRVGATALPDGSALVEITDRGIGLTEQECADLGRRMADPGDPDVDVPRRMGLFVVGRLAARVGARVWLSPGEPRGVTASLALPAAVLSTGPAAPAQDRDGSTGSWIGERFSRAVATPGPGRESWFGGAPLGAPAGPAATTATAGTVAFVPTASGTTGAGLPQREPGANEVPGTGPAPAARPATTSGRHAAPDPDEDDTPQPGRTADRSPEAIRRRYAEYQQGRRRGLAGTPPEPAETGEAGVGDGGAAGAGSAVGAAGAGSAVGVGTSGASDQESPSRGPDSADVTPTDVPQGAAGPGSGVGGTSGPESRPGGPDSADVTPTGVPRDAVDPGSGVGAQTSGASGRGSRPDGRDSANVTPVHVPWDAVDPGSGVGATSGPESPSGGPDSADVTPADVPWGASPVRTPTSAGSTSSGLPLRTPGANYVPGSLPGAPAPGGPATTGEPRPTTEGGPDAGGPGGAPGAGAGSGENGDPEDGTTEAGPAGDGTAGDGTAGDGTAGTGTTGDATAHGAHNGVGDTGPSTGNGTANGTDGSPGRAGERPSWDRSAEAIRRRFAAHQEGRRRGMERTGG